MISKAVLSSPEGNESPSSARDPSSSPDLLPEDLPLSLQIGIPPNVSNDKNSAVKKTLTDFDAEKSGISKMKDAEMLTWFKKLADALTAEQNKTESEESPPASPSLRSKLSEWGHSVLSQLGETGMEILEEWKKLDRLTMMHVGYEESPAVPSLGDLIREPSSDEQSGNRNHQSYAIKIEKFLEWAAQKRGECDVTIRTITSDFVSRYNGNYYDAVEKSRQQVEHINRHDEHARAESLRYKRELEAIEKGYQFQPVLNKEVRKQAYDRLVEEVKKSEANAVDDRAYLKIWMEAYQWQQYFFPLRRDMWQVVLDITHLAARILDMRMTIREDMTVTNISTIVSRKQRDELIQNFLSHLEAVSNVATQMHDLTKALPDLQDHNVVDFEAWRSKNFTLKWRRRFQDFHDRYDGTVKMNSELAITCDQLAAATTDYYKVAKYWYDLNQKQGSLVGIDTKVLNSFLDFIPSEILGVSLYNPNNQSSFLAFHPSMNNSALDERAGERGPPVQPSRLQAIAAVRGRSWMPPTRPAEPGSYRDINHSPTAVSRPERFRQSGNTSRQSSRNDRSRSGRSSQAGIRKTGHRGHTRRDEAIVRLHRAVESDQEQIEQRLQSSLNLDDHQKRVGFQDELVEDDEDDEEDEDVDMYGQFANDPEEEDRWSQWAAFEVGRPSFALSRNTFGSRANVGYSQSLSQAAGEPRVEAESLRQQIFDEIRAFITSPDIARIIKRERNTFRSSWHKSTINFIRWMDELAEIPWSFEDITAFVDYCLDVGELFVTDIRGELTRANAGWETVPENEIAGPPRREVPPKVPKSYAYYRFFFHKHMDQLRYFATRSRVLTEEEILQVIQSDHGELTMRDSETLRETLKYCDATCQMFMWESKKDGLLRLIKNGWDDTEILEMEEPEALLPLPYPTPEKTFLVWKARMEEAYLATDHLHGIHPWYTMRELLVIYNSYFQGKQKVPLPLHRFDVYIRTCHDTKEMFIMKKDRNDQILIRWINRGWGSRRFW